MFKFLVALLFVLNVNFESANSAQILAIFPFPGRTQYRVAQPYLKALAKRGHNLTVISQYPQKQKLKNFYDIPVKYENFDEQVTFSITGKVNPMAWYLHFLRNVSLSVLENPKVQLSLIRPKTMKFDLVITEVLHMHALYGFGAHFQAHLIGVATYGTDPYVDRLVGNISPLSYIPLATSKLTGNMEYWERFQNIKDASTEWYNLHFRHFTEQTDIYKHFFPQLPYELDDICKNFSLVLVNQHFSLSFPRPYVPNMIEVGGMFIDHKPKPLPDYIANFIDGAEHGAIYFSMDGILKSTNVDNEKLDVIVKVLGSLKQRVLWKFYDLELKNKPPNVLIRKILPHYDILAHPKVKLYVTPANLLHTTEAIYFAKPVVGMVHNFDEIVNIERTKTMGYGLGVEYKNLSEENLKNAIITVLENSTFTENAKIISTRFHDQPMKPMDRAIFWTEYVLRHDGAPFMQVGGRYLSFFQFYSIDSIAFLSSFSLPFFYLLYRIVLRIIIECRKPSKPPLIRTEFTLYNMQ